MHWPFWRFVSWMEFYGCFSGRRQPNLQPRRIWQSSNNLFLDPRNSTNEANYVPWLCLEKRNKFDAGWNLRKESQTILEITGQF